MIPDQKEGEREDVVGEQQRSLVSSVAVWGLRGHTQ